MAEHRPWFSPIRDPGMADIVGGWAVHCDCGFRESFRTRADARVCFDAHRAIPAAREAFPEQGMTFRQFAQHVIPDLSDEEADFVLWERTPFPLVQGRDDLLPFLRAERDRRAGEADR